MQNPINLLMLLNIAVLSEDLTVPYLHNNQIRYYLKSIKFSTNWSIKFYNHQHLIFKCIKRFRIIFLLDKRKTFITSFTLFAIFTVVLFCRFA